jgi:hypothetical protein
MKDIIITKNGKQAIIKPQTDAAKLIFKGEKLPHGFTTPVNEVHKIFTWAVTHNLSIDSEISMVIPQRNYLTEKQLRVIFPAVPKNFPMRPLFAIGTMKFKGDKFTGQLAKLSVNDKFIKGEEYPVYDNEGLFVVGSDGKGYKITPIAWTKIKYF